MKSKTFIITSFVAALASLIAATILTLEKIELWKNPDYVPSCSWNPLFSCQGPMMSWQSSALGLPNPILGMVGYALIIAVLVLSLTAKFPKWVWVGYLTGVTFAFGYVMWLMTQSLYDIQALCVYCMVVWTFVIPLFWVTVKEFLRTYFHEKKWANVIIRLVPALIIANYGAVLLMMYVQFQDFFNFMLGIR